MLSLSNVISMYLICNEEEIFVAKLKNGGQYFNNDREKYRDNSFDSAKSIILIIIIQSCLLGKKGLDIDSVFMHFFLLFR